MFRMRDGTLVSDPRLGRLQHFDPRSLNYRASEIAPAQVRSRLWALGLRLDQGRDGACVGFGNTHRLAATPIQQRGMTYEFAMSLYNAAKKIDPWPGEDYEGTAVLAGIKVAQSLGYVKEYRWCTSVEEMMAALQLGPLVVGTHWDNNMFRPRPSGLLEMGGGHAGGHCYLIRGLTLRPYLKGERASVGPCFKITNSWGAGWGLGGDAYVRVEDYANYLLPDGEQALLTEQRVKSFSTGVARRVTFAPRWWAQTFV